MSGLRPAKRLRFPATILAALVAAASFPSCAYLTDRGVDFLGSIPGSSPRPPASDGNMQAKFESDHAWVIYTTSLESRNYASADYMLARKSVTGSSFPRPFGRAATNSRVAGGVSASRTS